MIPRKIGITTTVPAEVSLAAGYMLVDLNNVFVSDPNPERLVTIAERDGFPQNCCTWIKGIYGVCKAYDIEKVLCVTSGDCSNTIMLMEVLSLEGFEVSQFAYPTIPNIHRMRHSLEALAETLGTTLEAAEKVRTSLVSCRNLTNEMDNLTWNEGVVSGWENHYWLVSTSDFSGDIVTYEQQLRDFIGNCRKRQRYSQDMPRIAVIGVPPIFAKDMYRYIEQQGARVVFNEIQRQFSMPHPANSLPEQYVSYTYPYSIFDRIQDIVPELRRRRVDGVIHYVQSFCHRGIGDIIFRRVIDCPILTLEGNADYILHQQGRTKVEAFIDMLQRRQRMPRETGGETKGGVHGLSA